MARYTQLTFGGVESYQVHIRKKQQKKKRQLVGKVLHLGGGVQSSTIVEMVVERKLPKCDFVVFADTGDEPQYVYEQIDYLADRLSSVGINLFDARRNNNEGEPVHIVDDLMLGGGRFASMPLFTQSADGKIGRLKRQCTHEYKIKPIQDTILGWLIDQGHAQLIQTATGPRRLVKRNVYIESWFGFSYDEWYRLGRGQFPNWQKAVYPLFDLKMTRQGCIDWLRKKGLPVPNKSSCIVCPYRDSASWKVMKNEYPKDFKHACEFDEWLRTPEAKQRVTAVLKQPVFLHRSCIPLQKVVLDEDDKQQDFFEICSGSCWT